jgi:hypothetical protein
VKAQVLFAALAVLREIEDSSCAKPLDLKIWGRAMRARIDLEVALGTAGLQIPIEAPKADEVAA